MNIDWNVETDGGGGLYEPGIYRVKPKEITEDEARSGNMQLKIKTEIVEGKYAGKPLTDYITLLPSVMWKLVKFIKAMGIDTKQLEQMDTTSGKFRALLNKCIGKTTYWKVEHAERNGKTYSDVTDYITDDEQVTDVDEPEFLKEAEKTWDE